MKGREGRKEERKGKGKGRGEGYGRRVGEGGLRTPYRGDRHP